MTESIKTFLKFILLITYVLICIVLDNITEVRILNKNNLKAALLKKIV